MTNAVCTRLAVCALMLALLAAGPCAVAADPPAPTPAAEVAERYVSIDFNDVDIGVFVKFISELTGKNFIIDDRVRGKVSVISPSKISVEEAYKVFESVLEVHGFTTVPSGVMVKIVPAPEARSKSIETLLQEETGAVTDRVVTQILTLQYADPEAVRKLLAPLVSKNSVLLAYPPTGMLILTDVYSNIERLMRILTAIDVAGTGQQIAVIALRYAEAVKMEKIVTAVFNPPVARGRRVVAEDKLQVVADERTNSLIVLANEDDIARLRTLVGLLDTETPRGQGKIRVYYLENAVAEDLAKVLQQVPVKDEKVKTPAKGEAFALSSEVKITADAATNSLIVVAAKEDYEVIEQIIAKLDIPRSMVFIECLIMEVNVTKEFSVGTEWRVFGATDVGSKSGAVGGGFSGSGYATLTDMATTGTLGAGGTVGIFSEAVKIAGIDFPNLAAVVEAYKKDKDVHIISTPQVLTTDNKEARIYIGKNVPFLTRQSTSTTDIDYSSYEYKDVGTTLKITPRINQERLVRLDISQEVTKLETAVGDVRPTTLKRTIDTTVIIQDGQTVVIGGLIDDSAGLTEYKVPLLGDIPILGWLFRSQSQSKDKTNLFVFLTPRVVRNPAEAGQLYMEKKDRMDRLDAESPLRDEADPAGSGEVMPSGQGGPIKMYRGDGTAPGAPKAMDITVPGDPGAPAARQND